jgi:type II secretory pathway component PulF
MAVYRFKASARDGRALSGEVEARSREEALAQLAERGLAPFSLRDAATRERVGERVGRSDRLSDVELAALLSDLAALLEAKTPLRTALRVVANATANRTASAILRRIETQVASGGDLTLAFAASGAPRIRFVAGLVAAGQKSGDVGAALRQGAVLLERDVDMRRQIAAAFAYPAFVVLVFLAAIMLLIGVVAPAMAPLAAEIPADRAIVLHGLVAAHNIFKAAAPVLGPLLALAVLAAIGMALIGAFTTAFARAILDGPLRGLTRPLEYGAFAASLSPLLASGVPAAEAVRAAASTLRNPIAQRRAEAAAQNIRDGAALAQAIAAVEGMPESIRRLSSIGEEAGAIAPMLARAGDFAQRDAVRRLKRFADIAAPALIITLGALIGLLSAGLLSGLTAIGEAALQ